MPVYVLIYFEELKTETKELDCCLMHLTFGTVLIHSTQNVDMEVYIYYIVFSYKLI